MSAILRIDEDQAYEKRILHYMRVNQELFVGIDPLEHLKSCKDVIKYLNDQWIKASIFFQPFTVPSKEFAHELTMKGHIVGLHAVHMKDYRDFSGDLNKIPNRFDGKVHGFTKHGSGKFNLVRWKT